MPSFTLLMQRHLVYVIDDVLNLSHNPNSK